MMAPPAAMAAPGPMAAPGSKKAVRLMGPRGAMAKPASDRPKQADRM
jgi:hypothetical protein